MAKKPVTNWATDYDIFDPDYICDPFPTWDDLRSSCPVAKSERWGGSWLPTQYDDISAIAHDVSRFTSKSVAVLEAPEEGRIPLPPIDSDPPEHEWARRLILPWFSHTRVAEHEPPTRELCNTLIDSFIDSGTVDAAQQYAQQIPVRVIARILGVPPELADTFTGWVRDVLEFAYDKPRVTAGRNAIVAFLVEQIDIRRNQPGDDIISDLLQAKVDGAPVPDLHVLGTAALLLIAGVDTTWSAIGSALWHLATHGEDRRKLVEDPTIMGTAVEELLRAYSPVTMARIVSEDTVFSGCPMKSGDRVLLSFAAANRDPAAFDLPDQVILDRTQNRHAAFGLGIHRCAGSNLARMELRVAIEEWLKRIPEFRLRDDAPVVWAGGQVRGPRNLPVTLR
jgi:cytochrome P450